MYLGKTAISFDDGQIFMLDTISYESRKWLVVTWLETHDPAVKKPERIVCLDDLEYTEDNFCGSQYQLLPSPIAKTVFVRPYQLPEKGECAVVDHPEVSIRFGSA